MSTTTNNPRLADKYKKEVVPALMKKFSYKTVMQAPRLTKICLNRGVNGAVTDKKLIDVAIDELTNITGQKAVATMSKKDISNFKLRKNMPIGARVTLRGVKMYEFLDRLVSVSLPRVRDFKGINDKAFDGRGNYTLGVTEQIIFPEIDIDKVNKITGLDITFVTTAGTNEEAFELLKELGMPFKNIKKSEKKFKIMLVHQKMTGHFLIGKWVVKKISGKSILIPHTIGPIKDDKYNSYIRVIFYLNNGNQLALSDLRKFSKIILGDPDEIENSSDLKMLGPDALSNEFNAKYLSPILKRKNIPIKTALLDQHIASGIGNIYADESLFVSKIHPLIKTRELSQKNVIHLLDSVKKVLKKSLRLRGTSSSDYRDTYGSKGKYHQHRLVYNREGLPCLICKTAIKRIKIGQRSSHFCPHCQKFK